MPIHPPGQPDHRWPTVHPDLALHLQNVADNCTACKLCVRECRFLQQHGTPKELALAYDPRKPAHLQMPFSCSLCRLCRAVCPVGLKPGSLFLRMRREAIRRGFAEKTGQCGVIRYEKRGVSKRYTFYGLPSGCDTVFFPGCSLPGSRPSRILHVLKHLQGQIPNLGVVLDCCTKPSHDMGNHAVFHAFFQEMTDYLIDQGIKTILVVCPNCYKVFEKYGGPLKVETIYQTLAAHPCTIHPRVEGTVTVHDPCVARENSDMHQGIRRLAEAAGLTVEEMRYHGRKTLCCGEGGAVSCVDRDLAQSWPRRRATEANGRPLLAYCGGCVDYLNPHTPTFHILDLLCDPAQALAGRAKIARAPFTYLNRLLLKRQLKKMFRQARTRERTFFPARLYRNPPDNNPPSPVDIDQTI